MDFLLPESIDDTNATQQMIDGLIACRKEIESRRKKRSIQKRQNVEFEYPLISIDNNHRFIMKVRQSTILADNFSVILCYINKDEDSIILFRCNGPHSGDNMAQPEHFLYHTHTLSEDDWQNGRKSYPNIRAVVTEYSTVDEAIQYFVNTCGINDQKHFFKTWQSIEEGYELSGQLTLEDIGN